MMTPYLKSPHIYWVKSGHRVELDSAELEPWSVAGNRRWLVTDEEGLPRTQRELLGTAVIRPMHIEDGSLHLMAA